MAYQAFYNKYRPQTFDEVVGQKAIVDTLKNAIKEDKIAHAYLFCGPRGTGKTTMARLFAKALDCKEGLGHQCNQCESCLAIQKGEHPDVIEIDAASNSTVDSVRQLIENVSYQPIMSRYKVYIIDEVHNMSLSAFNALLKTLEEPPSFVVFILATTEPQKIIPTILSRVQRFDFSKVKDEDLISNMKRVLDSEHVQYEEEALKLIASLADGGVRDSLSLLDQLVSYSGTKVTTNDVDTLFGLLSKKDELALVNSINEKKADEVLKTVKDKYEKGMDIVRFHDDLISIYKDLIVYKTTRDASLLEKLNEEEASSFDIPSLKLETNIKSLIEARRDYKTSEDLLSHLELSLLSLMNEESIVIQQAPAPALKATNSVSTNTPVLSAKAIAESKAPVKEDKVLASQPVIITSEVKKTEEVKKPIADDNLGYNRDELINLMERASKAERIDVAHKWENLTTSFASDKDYEARALYGMKARLVADDIILVTSKYMAEVVKINKKSVQPTLKAIAKDAFGKEYHILPIEEREFMDALVDFKKGNKPESHQPKIDFGENKTLSASTAFFDDLVNGKK